MKKKLRFFITTLKPGGAERVLINLLNWFDPEVYDITLLSVAGGENECGLPSYVHYRSILKNNSGRFGMLLQKILLKLPPRLFALLFLSGEFDYEIAYLEGIPTAFVAAKRTSGKKIAFLHYDLSGHQIDLAIYKDPHRCYDMYRRFDRVCFVSADSLVGFDKVYGHLEQSCVVHNVIDASAVLRGAQQPISRSFSAKGLKMVSVGRLALQKNYEELLMVFAELSADYDMELWIIGEGEERKNLENIIRKHHLDNVYLLGFCDNPYPYVKKADLYVCSSSFEGYNTAVLESVIIGTPVLTTDCAGMSELLDNGRFGMIVERSYDGLKNGLKAFLQSPEKLLEYRDNLAGFSPDDLPFARDYQELFGD